MSIPRPSISFHRFHCHNVFKSRSRSLLNKMKMSGGATEEKGRAILRVKIAYLRWKWTLVWNLPKKRAWHEENEISRVINCEVDERQFWKRKSSNCFLNDLFPSCSLFCMEIWWINKEVCQSSLFRLFFSRCYKWRLKKFHNSIEIWHKIK